MTGISSDLPSRQDAPAARDGVPAESIGNAPSPCHASGAPCSAGAHEEPPHVEPLSVEATPPTGDDPTEEEEAEAEETLASFRFHIATILDEQRSQGLLPPSSTCRQQQMTAICLLRCKHTRPKGVRSFSKGL